MLAFRIVLSRGLMHHSKRNRTSRDEMLRHSCRHEASLAQNHHHAAGPRPKTKHPVGGHASTQEPVAAPRHFSVSVRYEPF